MLGSLTRHPVVVTALLVFLVYGWMLYSIAAFGNPALTMVVYHFVLCFGGGLILQRLTGVSHDAEQEEKNFGNSWLITGVLMIISVLAILRAVSFVRPGLISPDIFTSGIAGLGLTQTNYLMIAIYFVIVNPLAEEYLWRTSLFPYLSLRYGRPISIVVTSLLFAGYHLIVTAGIFTSGWLLLPFVFTFVGGIIFSYLYLRTRSLFSSVLLHSAINLTLIVIGYRFL